MNYRIAGALLVALLTCLGCDAKQNDAPRTVSPAAVENEETVVDREPPPDEASTNQHDVEPAQDLFNGVELGGTLTELKAAFPEVKCEEEEEMIAEALKEGSPITTTQECRIDTAITGRDVELIFSLGNGKLGTMEIIDTQPDQGAAALHWGEALVARHGEPQRGRVSELSKAALWDLNGGRVSYSREEPDQIRVRYISKAFVEFITWSAELAKKMLPDIERQMREQQERESR